MIYLFVLFVVLQVVDIYLTYRVLSCSGREENKVMAFLIAKLGLLPGLIIPKSVAVLIIGYVTFYAAPDWWIYALGALCTWYVGVSAYNKKQVD